MTLPRRLFLGALGTLPLTRLAQGQAAHRLTVLHVNDFHSRHEAVDGRAMSCSAGRDACFGGSARLATAIKAQRAAAEADGRAVLLLDGGDQFQGSLFFTAHHGMAELAVQHALGTDAMAVGNHEFDSGPAVLGRYADAARFPVLSANIDAADEPALSGKLRRYTLLRRAGLVIGVVGLTTPETRTSSSPGPAVRFLDPAPALAVAAADARAEGAQLLIVLSHLGLPADVVLPSAGSAVIVGGHSHSVLSNVEREAVDPHPTPAPGGALVVQAGAYGRFLGRLDLDVAADGRVLAYGGECRHVGLDLAPDPEVEAVVATYRAPLDAIRRKQVAVLPDGLGNEACRFASCRLGQAVAQAMRDAGHGAQVALMNAGGLRIGLRAGPATLGDVLDALPFGNTLASFELSGADLGAVAAHGAAQIGRGGFAQWAGLRLSGTQLEIEETDGRWTRLDPARRYRMVTNNFLRNGGDGYTMLRDRAIDAYDTGPAIADLLAEALEAGLTLN